MGKSQREKGKRIERWFVNELKGIFPAIRRNAGTQSQSGGVDLENTRPFNFEIKGGAYCKIAKIRKFLNQVEEEGEKDCWDAVLVKPDREEPYVIMPFKDFKSLLEDQL